jgi:hypothetical protein
MTPLPTLDPLYLVILCMFHCIIFAFARSSPGFDRHWSHSVLDILPLQVTPRSGCPNEHALVTTFNLDSGMCPWQHLTLLCVTVIFLKSLLPRCLSTISHGYSSVCSRIWHFQTWWMLLLSLFRGNGSTSSMQSALHGWPYCIPYGRFRHFSHKGV